MEKVTFVMHLADPKKHSNRFDFERSEVGNDLSPKFKPSFYVPNSHFDGVKRIRVTIEELP